MKFNNKSVGIKTVNKEEAPAYKLDAELELARLANDANMSYEDKVNSMIYQLERISKVNNNIEKL